MLPLQKKELDLNKYKYILKYEDQFNYIFPSCHCQMSTPMRAFMYNTGSSGDISVTSNRKRSIDEPFSRQLRQKSSDVDKPESSQNGMTLDIALDELSGVASVLTYGIATQCLQDPIKLRAYSRLPTIEKKIEFLHVSWRLEHDPASTLAVSPCFVFNLFLFCSHVSYLYFDLFMLSRACHHPASVMRGA